MQAIIEGNLYEIEPAVKVILDRLMCENNELKRENKRLKEGYQKSIGVIAATDCVKCKDKSVSKQSVIDYLNGYLHSIGEDNLFDSGQRRALTNAIQDISAIKTADVQPVKHAYWEEKQDMNGDTYYHCTNCNEDFVLVEGTPKDNLYYYCPNCGAKMDGGADNETD